MAASTFRFSAPCRGTARAPGRRGWSPGTTSQGPGAGHLLAARSVKLYNIQGRAPLGLCPAPGPCVNVDRTQNLPAVCLPWAAPSRQGSGPGGKGLKQGPPGGGGKTSAAQLRFRSGNGAPWLYPSLGPCKFNSLSVSSYMYKSRSSAHAPHRGE